MEILVQKLANFQLCIRDLIHCFSNFCIPYIYFNEKLYVKFYMSM